MDAMQPIEAEWGVIGIMARMRKNERADILQTLTAAGTFCDDDAGRAFNAIYGIIRRGEPLTFDTIEIKLTQVYGKETAGYVMPKVIDATTAHGLESHALPTYAAAVLEGRMRRTLDDIGKSLRSVSGDDAADINEAISTARNNLRTLVTVDGKWKTGADVAMEAFTAMEEQKHPIPTGFAELDEVLCGGLVKPELTIAGARPAKGKSAFLLACAMSGARSGKHVCYISLEMSDEQIGQRELASHSGVSVSKMRYGAERLEQPDWDMMAEAISQLDAEGMREFFHVYSIYGMTVEQLSGIAQNMADRGELDLLIVDYIQLLKTAQKTRSDFERIGIVSKELKALALMLNIPVLTAAQVKRQGTNGGASRAPGLDELRGSGDLEQDADNVLLLHIPENSEDAALKGEAGGVHEDIYDFACIHPGYSAYSIEVAKQRQGGTKRTWCLFHGKTMRFMEDTQDNRNRIHTSYKRQEQKAAQKESGTHEQPPQGFAEAEDASWLFAAQEEIRL